MLLRTGTESLCPESQADLCPPTRPEAAIGEWVFGDSSSSHTPLRELTPGSPVSSNCCPRPCLRFRDAESRAHLSSGNPTLAKGHGTYVFSSLREGRLWLAMDQTHTLGQEPGRGSGVGEGGATPGETLSVGPVAPCPGLGLKLCLWAQPRAVLFFLFFKPTTLIKA